MAQRITITTRQVLDEGYRRVYSPTDDRPDEPHASLAAAQVGQVVHATARAQQRGGLSEADLLRRMQAHGIGRPSTYAETLEALRRHRYIEDGGGMFSPTRRGRAALAWLTATYPRLFALDFTAWLEERLDGIAMGEAGYHDVVQAVWDVLRKEEKDG